MQRPQFHACGQTVQCLTTVPDARDTTARARVRWLSIRPKEVQQLVRPYLEEYWRTASTAKQIEGIFGEGTERTESRHHVHDRAEAAPSYRRRSRP